MSNYIFEYLNNKYVIKEDFKFLDALPIFQGEIPVNCVYCAGKIDLIAEEATQFVKDDRTQIRIVCPTCKKDLTLSVKSLIENRESLYLELLENFKSSNKSSLDSTDIEVKVLNEKYLDFLHDQEKLYKLFLKKGIMANYFEVITLVNKVSAEIYNNILEERRINPVYQAISNKFGNDLDKRGIIKEFLKMPFDNVGDYTLIVKLLNKFNISSNEDDVKHLVQELSEEIELEKFEESFGKPDSIEIIDFTKLGGQEFEEYVKRIFEFLGYRVVMTSLTGDQGADLIITRNNEKTVVQVKNYTGNVSNKAVQEVVAAINFYKANKARVITGGAFTKSAIDLALSNNVELWDGQKLRSVILEINRGKTSKEQSCRTYSIEEEKDFQQASLICRVCNEEFNVDVDTKAVRKERRLDFEVRCPHCGMTFSASVEMNT